MSVDKKPERSHHETLALIADKLSIERPSQGDPTPEPTAALGVEIPPLAAANESTSPPPPFPAMPVAANLEPALSATDTGSPPPPIPPAPPPPKIEPFVQTAAVPPAPKPAIPAAVAPSPPPAAPAMTSPKTSLNTAFTTYLPIAIALFSLGLSVYQGILFRESIDIMQRNVARGEYARTCREIIETYFQIKPRIGALMQTADRGNVAGASRVSEASRLDAQAAIAKFGGLGTYLANFQDAGTRARYTELTKLLSGIYDNARNTPVTDIDRVFAPADRLFSQMNDDCARLSRAMGL
jgi:hypothetical protein